MRNIAVVADDNNMGAERLCDILRMALTEHYEIVRAHNGKEALQFIQERMSEIGLVMLDMFMSEMDGLYILRIYNESGWQELFPVFMVTSRDIAEYEDVCYRLGAYDFAKKPFDADKVIQRVQHAIELYNYQREANKSDIERLKEIFGKSETLQIQKEGESNTLRITDERGTNISVDFDKNGNIL